MERKPQHSQPPWIPPSSTVFLLITLQKDATFLFKLHPNMDMDSNSFSGFSYPSWTRLAGVKMQFKQRNGDVCKAQTSGRCTVNVIGSQDAAGQQGGEVVLGTGSRTGKGKTGQRRPGEAAHITWRVDSNGGHVTPGGTQDHPLMHKDNAGKTVWGKTKDQRSPRWHRLLSPDVKCHMPQTVHTGLEERGGSPPQKPDRPPRAPAPSHSRAMTSTWPAGKSHWKASPLEKPQLRRSLQRSQRLKITLLNRQGSYGFLYPSCGLHVSQ